MNRAKASTARDVRSRRLRGRLLALTVAMLALYASGGAIAAAHRDKALEDQLLATMKILASDDFMGREPGTEGEARTLRWLGKAWFDIGLVSGTNDPGHPWFAPVTLVARAPASSTAQILYKGRLQALGSSDVLMLTSGRRSLVRAAPLYFVGRGALGLPPRAELAGRVAVLLDRLPDVPGVASGRSDDGKDANGADSRNSISPDGVAASQNITNPQTGVNFQNSDRQNALLAGGASAVLTVLDGQRNLASVSARRKRTGYALASEALGGDLEGFVTADAIDGLLAAAHSSLAAIEAEADRPDFAPHLLGLTANLEATTTETTIHSHNLIGKLPGRRPGTGAVLLLAHWDHFGTCAQAPAEHLICNGAIDNASGVAALTEIARRLAKAPPMDRDVYFLSTTAEELGLLGAEAFAEDPPLPLKSIVAAFNLDSVAIAPAGTAVGIVGKGMTGLEKGLVQVARAQGRAVSNSSAPNDYIGRQDGAVLLHHDVPTVMITSAYGEIGRLERFFDTDYHRPSDIVKPGIELGGAAEDVALHVALVRWFADTHSYPGPAGS